MEIYNCGLLSVTKKFDNICINYVKSKFQTNETVFHCSLSCPFVQPNATHEIIIF